MPLHHKVHILAALPLIWLAACESPTQPSGAPPDVRAWVVGDAARGLDRDGHFVLPPPTAPGPLPITSAANAIHLATTFLRQFTAPSTVAIGGISIRDDLERQRGAPIAFGALVPAERAYFAESPYQALPDTVPPYLRKYLGPSFLIPLLDRNDPAVVIASSAYNTDLAVEAGQIVFPRAHGDDFWWAGIPAGAGYVLPITPEHAVEVVWKATRTRVNRVPHLIGPGRLFFPHYVRWRVSLEQPVRVQGLESGREYDTSELYVSGRVLYSQGRGSAVQEQIEVALAEQPQRDTIPDRCSEGADEMCSLVVELRPGFPVRFEPTQVVR